eukprot:CAMPEP_0170511880 /NCGR_PEP_ID=MMETSP0208-20121228/66542_1 /TAXON_ID=197538 /ORGANISM="Strombidium inclinatum, Strain S3" /LENGTH=137 /DNA_ID=CAMNT_0010795455 /DNA_START=1157 /DNA_END=1570 /DNA_ORIENTATION=+
MFRLEGRMQVDIRGIILELARVLVAEVTFGKQAVLPRVNLKPHLVEFRTHLGAELLESRLEGRPLGRNGLGSIQITEVGTDTFFTFHHGELGFFNDCVPSELQGISFTSLLSPHLVGSSVSWPAFPGGDPELVVAVD